MRILKSPCQMPMIALCEHVLIPACVSVSDPSDAQIWQLMAGIKSNILRRMDAAAPGVRICCVKFLQQVVLVQTPGVADPRVITAPHQTYTAS
jgi:hypothetical protein